MGASTLLLAKQGTQHHGAQEDTCLISVPVADSSAVGGGEEQDSIFSKVLGEVRIEVARLLVITKEY